MDLRPLDWILLRRDDITAHLARFRLTNPRVVGWAGAGSNLPGPAEIQVDLPEVTDLAKR